MVNYTNLFLCARFVYTLVFRKVYLYSRMTVIFADETVLPFYSQEIS